VTKKKKKKKKKEEKERKKKKKKKKKEKRKKKKKKKKKKSKTIEPHRGNGLASKGHGKLRTTHNSVERKSRKQHQKIQNRRYSTNNRGALQEKLKKKVERRKGGNRCDPRK